VPPGAECLLSNQISSLREPIGEVVEHRSPRKTLKTLNLRPKKALLKDLAGSR
jgi:hypothetical protein